MSIVSTWLPGDSFETSTRSETPVTVALAGIAPPGLNRSSTRPSLAPVLMPPNGNVGSPP